MYSPPDNGRRGGWGGGGEGGEGRGKRLEDSP